MKELFINNPSSIVASNRILYTPSTFARLSLLHLQEIGELNARIPHTSSRSGLQSYLFFTVVAGSGFLSYNDNFYTITAGDCVFIDCHHSYSHTTSPSNLWELRWIHFYGANMPQIYAKYIERGGRPVFRPDNNERINDVWSSLMTVAGSHDYMRDMLINQYLSELMVCVMRESWHPEEQSKLSTKKQLVKPVKEYIEQNYGEKITLEYLSTQFYINKYYLTKIFKEQYGVSISSYLLNLRITKAKQLLRFSEKTVEEIGIECGFGAAHYFSQTFKNVEGVPPSKYRDQWKSNNSILPNQVRKNYRKNDKIVGTAGK